MSENLEVKQEEKVMKWVRWGVEIEAIEAYHRLYHSGLWKAKEVIERLIMENLDSIEATWKTNRSTLDMINSGNTIDAVKALMKITGGGLGQANAICKLVKAGWGNWDLGIRWDVLRNEQLWNSVEQGRKMAALEIYCKLAGLDFDKDRFRAKEAVQLLLLEYDKLYNGQHKIDLDALKIVEDELRERDVSDKEVVKRYTWLTVVLSNDEANQAVQQARHNLGS